MAKLSDLLIVAALGFGGYQVYEHYTGKVLQNDLGRLDLQLKGVTMNESDIDVNINFQNPNSEAITLRSFVGNMYVNDKPVAQIKMFANYVIKGNSEKMVQLIAMPKELSLYRQLFRSAHHGHANVRIAGTINVNNAAVPITLSYTTS